MVISRVRVWSGDQSKYLGEGKLLGFANVFLIKNDDGSIGSLPNAEKKPKGIPAERICREKNNPKIKLNNGKIVYGCQVWWKSVDDV